MTSTLDPYDALAELVTLEIGCAPGVDYADNFPGWLHDVTGEWAWSTQVRIAQSVETNRATAVLSCNNSGKTWLAARIIVKWILAHWREGVRVVTTAPTAAQIALLLWQEIRTAMKAARAHREAGGPVDVPGTIVGSPYPQWKIGDTTVAFGRHPADHNQSALQGVHAPWVLVVVDEAGGVSQAIFDAVDKVTTNRNARILLIGNPDNKVSPFGRVTDPGSGYNVIQIDGLRTPNMTEAEVTSGRYPFLHAHMVHEGIPFAREVLPAGKEDEIRVNLLDPGFVEERYVRYCGLDPKLPERVTFAELGQIASDAAAQSQLFTQIVRGDFPDVAGDSVIPLGHLRLAQARWVEWNQGHPALPRTEFRPRALPAVAPRAEQPGKRIIGVDVATTNGADQTMISPRQGWVTLGVHPYPVLGDTHLIAAEVVKYTGRNPAGAIAVVDGIGIGAGVRDALRHVHGITAVSFEAYLQSDRMDRDNEHHFANDRSAAWWRLRELLDPVRGVPIAIPPDPDLEVELTAPKWKIRASTRGGVIQVESKDDIRARLGRSTDRADAVIQSYWIDGGGGAAAVPAPPEPAEPLPWVRLGAAARPTGDEHVNGGVGSSGVVAYTLGTRDDDDEGE